MIVGSSAIVVTVLAVTIGVICRIQFRTMPSSSPPCIIQRINSGSHSSADPSRRRSCDGADADGRDKRIVLLSINGGMAFFTTVIILDQHIGILGYIHILTTYQTFN